MEKGTEAAIKGAFISYSHKDMEQVKEIVDLIEKDLKFPIWYDHNLRGGDQYNGVIADSITKYEYFIFLVSRNSANSQYCVMELEFARSEKRKIIAVWLERFDPPPRVRMVISGTHYIYSNELRVQELRQSLQEALMGNLVASPTVQNEEPSISERIQEGCKYFLKAEDKKRIQQLLQMEKKGKYGSCYTPDNAVLLGMAYELGIHTQKDAHQAEFYYRVAAHKGNLDGEYLLLSLQMENGDVDIPKATKRMSELAEAGSLLAMVYWGEDLYSGRYGVQSDKKTAYRWWKKAALQHQPEAQYYLAFGYQTGEAVEQDLAIALMYARESEESGFPRAFRLQGYMYMRGQFVDKDLDKAEAMYRKAIELGDQYSLVRLGDVELCREHPEQALEYYQQAVDLAEEGKIKTGAPYYTMGNLYLQGKVVEKDVQKGAQMCLKAAELGNSLAKKWAAYRISRAVEDQEACAAYLEQARQYGCRWTEYYMGRLEERKGSSGYASALSWFEQGIDKGDVGCMIAAMHYYGCESGKLSFRNRQKALATMRLFFALWEDDSKEVERDSVLVIRIVRQYYMYALELGTGAEGNADKELALYYFRKCLEADEKMEYWGDIARVAQRKLVSYIGIYAQGKIITLDPAFGEQIVELLLEYYDRFAEKQTERLALNASKRSMYSNLNALINYYETPFSVFSASLTPEKVAEKIQYYKSWEEKLAPPPQQTE